MRRLIVTLLVLLSVSAGAWAGDIDIHVNVADPGKPVSQYLTGACIEDVNHEIYGGLYSQMIFGESFQEPESSRPLVSFVAYEGSWTVTGEELRAAAGAGLKLVHEHTPIAAGTI